MTDRDPTFLTLHTGSRYRTPIDLRVTPDRPARYLVVGACLAQAIPEAGALIDRAHQGDFILLNNVDGLPEIATEKASGYDFQIIQLPLRTLFGNAYFRLPDTLDSHERFLRETEERVARYLDNALKLNTDRKLLTFVLGFLVPQADPLGRFRPRYDLRNVVHFIERLNMFLVGKLAERENVFYVDVDQIAGGIGKRHCQDDMVWSFTHGTTLSDGDHDHDLSRIEPPAPMHDYYPQKWIEFFEAVMHEIFAMVRSLRAIDMVKLVVVDLDDTLWRGVAAESTLGIVEGWPMGFMEALLLLKKRGILLAIASKNDERFILENWDRITHGHIALSDFATHRINFEDKARNVAAIIEELYLRPESTVMIDDSPVERAAVEAGIPGVRVLGRDLYYLKRMLLWAPETQQPASTAESTQRTEMIRAQLARESTRGGMSPEEFLLTLELRATISRITATSDLQMSRTLELFNKTNQFNTTGRRYSLEECQARLAAGDELYVLSAEDRFTRYGLVGAAWTVGNRVDHLVLSCRVIGLGLENAFLGFLANQLRGQGHGLLLGRLLPTAANVACRSLYAGNGFTQDPANADLWSRRLATPMSLPGHVSLGA